MKSLGTLVVVVLFTVRVVSQKPAHETDLLDDTLMNLAGKGATSCGRVGVFGKHEKTDACVEKAAEGKQPFYARYQLFGFDTERAVGFAGNREGQVFEVEFVRDDRAEQRYEIDPRSQQVSPKECPSPIRFHRSGDQITCMQASP